MNHSIYSADRSTHLKIVVVALIAGIVVAGFSISARTTPSDEGYTQTATRRPEGRQAGGRSPARRSRPFANEEFKEFTRLFSSPQSRHVDHRHDPNDPQVFD